MHIQSLFIDFPARALLLLSLVGVAVAQDRTTEQGEAQISECTPYYYAPVSTQIHNFPPIWTPATILANDTAAQAKWNSIAASIPTNILPKGQPNGSTINVTYDTVNDPDCWWTVHQCTTPKLAGLPMDIASVPEPKTMGYGFDDGPNCSHNAFYDFLESQNQKATMFYIGSNVMDWPLEAQRALADGHEISVHTWSHRYMTSFSSEDAFAELYYTMQAIKLVTGVTPTSWRPPFGDVDDRIRAIANALGLQTIIWKYDSNDWKNGVNGITPQDVDADYQYFIDNVTSGTFNTVGGIMLTHELNNYTMSEAIKYYPQLQAAFTHMVPIGVALNKTQPYVETNYSLPTFSQYVAGQTNVSGGSNSSSGGSSSGGGSTSGGSTQSGGKNSALPAVIAGGLGPLLDHEP
ncbi:glycoside hydrolase/deacetylase [Artomyces pyxidatus]|uniref:Glycoside hydrolase/deacetylase n=1 Tax=Artomyces pyxidatus TaxID=48021 RepID=A0ACB8TGC4_9AGAM|nr:glycoside hydrolase/deacetylase [Artomyces pyxidatus]